MSHCSWGMREQRLILEKLSHLTNPVLFSLPDSDVLKNLNPTRRSGAFSQLPILPVGRDDVRIPSRLKTAAAAIFQHISNHLPWGELIFASLEPDRNL